MRELFEESGLFESIPDEKELDKMFNDSSGSPFEGNPKPFVTKNGFNVYFQKSLFLKEVILKVCRDVDSSLKERFPSIVPEKKVLLSYVEFPNNYKTFPSMLSTIREETGLWKRTIEELKSLGVGFPVTFMGSGNDFLFNLERIGTDLFSYNAKIQFYFKGRVNLCSKGKYRQSFIGRNCFLTFRECLRHQFH